jgi:hypothetical protein
VESFTEDSFHRIPQIEHDDGGLQGENLKLTDDAFAPQPGEFFVILTHHEHIVCR